MHEVATLGTHRVEQVSLRTKKRKEKKKRNAEETIPRGGVYLRDANRRV